MINIRQKGADGERQVCDMLNAQVLSIWFKNKITAPYTTPCFQRNQNQSAVGGSDLLNEENLPLSVEVKRQEQLAINTWWTQCFTSAQKHNIIPVLIFKQNRKQWRVMIECGYLVRNDCFICDLKQIIPGYRVEIAMEDFLHWFNVNYSLLVEAKWK